MKIKVVRGISGRWKDHSFHYASGDIVEVDDGLANSEIRAGNAIAADYERKVIRIKEPDFKVPQIEEDDVRKAVIKRRKRV